MVRLGYDRLEMDTAMIRRALAVALLLWLAVGLAGPAAAESPLFRINPATSGVEWWNGSAFQSPATTPYTAAGSGATASASAAQRAMHANNIVDDFGASADTLRVLCSVTTTQGQTSLTLAGCTGLLSGAAYASPLLSSSAGKNILIAYAGASLGTAPITGTGSLSNGSGYLDVPTITVSDATGSGALLLANMELNTATVISGDGGIGCTNGTQTFALTGGTLLKSTAVSAITIASPGVLTFATASPPNGTAVYLTTDGELPTGFYPNTTYFIVNASGSTAQLSASSGGTAINTTGANSGNVTLNYQAALVTGTVSGGVLSGALTVSAGGLYQDFRSPGNVLNPQSIILTGGGCTSPPVITATFDVASVTHWAVGQDYTAPTATFSDGNATLTGLTIGTPVGGTLSTTLATVTDGLHGTLAAPAGSTLTAKTALVVIGGADNHNAIQNAISGNSAPTSALGGSPILIPPVQPDYCFGMGSSVAIPSKYVVTFRGTGVQASSLCGTAAFTGLFTKDDTYFGNGAVFENLILDGDKAVNKIYSGGCDTQQSWINVKLINPAPLGIAMQIGDNDGCAGGHYQSVYTDVNRSIYTWPYDGPLIGKHIQATDTVMVDSENVGAMLYNTQYDSGSAGGHCIGCHDYTIDHSTRCFDIISYRVELVQPECDAPWIASIGIHNSQVWVRGGSYNTTSINAYYGVNVDANLNHVHVEGFSAIKVALPENRVFWQGPIGLDDLSIGPQVWPQFGPNLVTVLCQGAQYNPYISGTGETILVDCPIPAGLMGRYGSIIVTSAERLTGASTTGTNIIYKLGNASTALSASSQTGLYGKSSAGWTSIILPPATIQNASCAACQINGSIGFIGGGTGGIGTTGWQTTGVTDFYITATTAAGDTLNLARWSVVLQSVNAP